MPRSRPVSLIFGPGGEVSHVHDEAAPGLYSPLGPVTAIRRASRVEPTTDMPPKWTADMAYSGGPVLGPFDTRTQALAAEAAWLLRNDLGTPTYDDAAFDTA